MPFYWGDYLRDTGHLTAAEHGAYMLLIGHYWTTGKPLPTHAQHLFRIARMSAEEWKGVENTIMAFFYKDNGCYFHARIEKELNKAKEITEKRSMAGRASAKQRANKIPTGVITSVPTKGITNDKQTAIPSQPQSQSPLQSDTSSLRSDGADAPPDATQIDLNSEMPLGLIRAPDGDWSLPLFRQGLAWLAACARKPPDKMRSLVGKWLASAGQNHRLVFEAMVECQRDAIADPISYLTAKFGGKNGPTRQASFDSVVAAGRAAAAGK